MANEERNLQGCMGSLWTALRCSLVTVAFDVHFTAQGLSSKTQHERIPVATVAASWEVETLYEYEWICATLLLILFIVLGQTVRPDALYIHASEILTCDWMKLLKLRREL